MVVWTELDEATTGEKSNKVEEEVLRTTAAILDLMGNKRSVAM